jgi:hypothetical protein
MITKAVLRDWAERSRTNQVNQVSSDACDVIRNSQHKLAPDVSFTEFSEAVLDLCNWMPSASLGWSIAMRSYVSTAALTVFDRATMANESVALGRLFERADKYLCELRDSNCWDDNGFLQINETIRRNVDLMPAESYQHYMENAASYGLKHSMDSGKSVDQELFYDHEEDYHNHKQLLTNQALKAVINHGFKNGTSSEELENTDGVEESLRVSDILSRMAQAGIRMPVFQLDMLQVTQLMERLILSFVKTKDEGLRARLSDGAEALAAITLRVPDAAPTARTNCFRPYYHATNWRVWMDTEPLSRFTHAVAYFADAALDVDYNPKIASALKTLRMQLLIDGTMTAQAMGRQRTPKAIELNKCAVLMGDFVRKMMIPCEQYLMDKGALAGLDVKARTVLISLLPQGETKLHLLKQNKASKGQVLMDDLGI